VRLPSEVEWEAPRGAARLRARVSPGRAARCAVTAGRPGARRTSAFASREIPTSRTSPGRGRR
jgi:hypothetical protein